MQVVFASLMRYRWGSGGEANIFGCLSNKVRSYSFCKLFAHSAHVRQVCCSIAISPLNMNFLNTYTYIHLYAGVVPDIVTMAKGIGNGHPISAIVTSQKTAELHDSIAPSIFPSVRKEL